MAVGVVVCSADEFAGAGVHGRVFAVEAGADGLDTGVVVRLGCDVAAALREGTGGEGGGGGGVEHLDSWRFVAR